MIAEDFDRRYVRQTMLAQIGTEGQMKLLGSSALVVGLGGLGSPVALYLTGAGVGHIGLADADRVAIHNLQRQILYDEASVGLPKTEAARERLAGLSSGTRFDLYPEGLTDSNARDIISQYDLVVDCTDNFATRFLIDNTCHELGKPWIMGAISEFGGMVTMIQPGKGNGLSGLFGDSEELSARKPATGGVIGATPGVVGAIEAAEAVKYLAGMDTALSGKLMTIDLLTMQTSIFEY